MINDIINRIEKILPQTQCGECGFKGCRPYAEALASKAAPIDRCPPGGTKVLQALADVLNCDSTPYLPEMATKTRPPQLALIREEECIGCTKCIQACPVDAIVGAAKSMHAIVSTECTGCGLCVEPCPVDCIDLVPQAENTYDQERAHERHQARIIRDLRQQDHLQTSYRAKKNLAASTATTAGNLPETQAKQDYILQALARVQARKNE